VSDAVDTVLFDLDDTICRYERSADEVLSVAFDRVGVEPFFTGREYVDRFDEFATEGAVIDEIRADCFATFAAEADRDPAVGREIAAAYAAERDQTRVEFLPGAEAALEAVAADHEVALVTNGDPELQSPKVESLGIGDHFETVVHGGHDAPYKPDPAPFHVALDHLGARPERAVHVGNSLESDVAGAHAAGLQSVWLADGTDPEPEPDYVLDSVADLRTPPWTG